MSAAGQPESLPTLDLRRFEAGGAERSAFLSELRLAAGGVGFLTGHGVDDNLIRDALSLSRRFFALPEQDKLAIEMVNSPHFRGYNRAGFEHTRGEPDWREQVDVGPERPALPFDRSAPPWTRLQGVTDLAGVKGKTIATYGIGAPPQVAFQVTLAKAGIDPETDVTWKAVPFDLVGETVNRGDADLAAHLDPWAYSIEKQFGFTKIADTQTGVYENHTCCVLGTNGPFLQANKDALRRLAEANIEVHDYTANHPDEVAKWYFETLNPAGLSEQDPTEISESSSTIIIPSVRRSPTRSGSPPKT
jgi:hypothetical protein